MAPPRGGRSRTVASRARWKVEDALEIIKQSRDEGYEKVVKGGVARLSFGSEGPGDDDDTLWVWDNEELLPNGGHMVAVRKATFDERWPYTGRRGWRPTSNKLSEAGFHFTPTDEDEDGCTCIYCGVELGGWERTDDPVHEHQRRRPQCPFFHCIVSEALPSDTSRKRDASFKDSDEESFEVLPSKKRTTTSNEQDSRRSSTGLYAPHLSDASQSDDLAEQDEALKQLLTDGDHEPESVTKVHESPNLEPTASTEPSQVSTTQLDVPSDASASAAAPVTRPKASLVVQASISEEEPATTSGPASSSAPPAADTSDGLDVDGDEAQVESPIPSTRQKSSTSFPNIQDYLPYPFPHRHSSIDPPPLPNPHKVTVLEWITQQQNYLLDTMKERIEQRLTSMRQRNIEERKRIEKTLRD
ncbi:hypothetical protein MNAN1_003805 [Malassezia nana]|uniref:Protein bir1 n=1 Tax=Malassezia nana TaxID=180528 RepID=A0AAF0EQH6_9BASI|nr:hypothetical protein MNAN1_003805 [Malassezia nana]